MGKPLKERKSRATRSRRQTRLDSAERVLLLAVARFLRSDGLHGGDDPITLNSRANLLAAIGAVEQTSFDSGWYDPDDDFAEGEEEEKPDAP